jgi:hypothetical protein
MNSQLYLIEGTALVEPTLMHYMWSIEFRPNDLASPRALRRTDDLPPNLD